MWEINTNTHKTYHVKGKETHPYSHVPDHKYNPTSNHNEWLIVSHILRQICSYVRGCVSKLSIYILWSEMLIFHGNCLCIFNDHIRQKYPCPKVVFGPPYNPLTKDHAATHNSTLSPRPKHNVYLWNHIKERNKKNLLYETTIPKFYLVCVQFHGQNSFISYCAKWKCCITETYRSIK